MKKYSELNPEDLLRVEITCEEDEEQDCTYYCKAKDISCWRKQFLKYGACTYNTRVFHVERKQATKTIYAFHVEDAIRNMLLDYNLENMDQQIRQLCLIDKLNERYEDFAEILTQLVQSCTTAGKDIEEVDISELTQKE